MNPKRMAIGFFAFVLGAMFIFGVASFFRSQSKSQIIKERVAFRDEVIDQTRKHLVAKWNISTPTQEVRDYVKNVMLKEMTEEIFAEQIKFMKAEIAAAKAVYYDGLSPKEAKKKYLSEWLDDDIINEYSINYKTEGMILEAEEGIPEDLEDSIERSLPSQRKVVEGAKVAAIILSNTEITAENFQWYRRRFQRSMVKYALEHRQEINPHWSEDELEFLFENWVN